MKIRDVLAVPFMFMSLFFEWIALKIWKEWTLDQMAKCNLTKVSMMLDNK